MTLLALALQQVCACQAKRNGNTPAEAAPQRRFIACLATPMALTLTASLETLRGTTAIQEAQHTPLPANSPMRLACTTCQAMCMSGAMIGMEVRITAQAHLQTQQDLRQVRTACCAAATGASSPAAAARRPVASPVPAPAATPSASVSRGLCSSLYPLLIPWNQLLFYFYHFTFTFLCQNCGSSFGKKSRLDLCVRNRLVATQWASEKFSREVNTEPLISELLRA